MSIAEFNWDLFPSTKLEQTNMSTPLGCMFSPFKEECPTTDKELMSCSSCGGYINPYIRIDRQNKMWWCPLCRKTTYFPKYFDLPDKSIPDPEIPIQIRPTTRNTIDYLLPTDLSQLNSQPAKNMILAFLVDRYQLTDALHLNEFNALKSHLIKELASVPSTTRILLVTFADGLEVHSPTRNEVVAFTSESLIKNSEDIKYLQNESIVDVLKAKLFPSLNLKPNHRALLEAGYLSTPSQELFDYIDSLRPKLTSSFKAPRATGLALLSTALMLTKFCAPFSHGKIHAFLTGPATLVPGRIVTESEHIRSHHDVANFKAPHFVSASKFYQYISYILCGYQVADAYQAVYTSRVKLVDFTTSESTPKFSCDLYTGSLDQVGIYEMKHLATASGGSIILTDSFSSIKFAHALSRQLSISNNRVQLCQLTILTSPGVKIMKAVAGLTELQSSYQSSKLRSMHHDKISDSITRYDSSLKKRNFTNQWYLGHVSTEDTIAVYFDIETASSSAALSSEGIKEVYIQFHLKFWDEVSSAFVSRVSTVKRMTTLAVLAGNQVKLSNGKYRLVNTKSNIMKEKALLESFNDRAWIALFARLLISKIDTSIGFESFEDVVHEVDNALLRIIKVFGGVTIDPQTTDTPILALKNKFAICSQFQELPALSYSLRRNPQLVRIFNSSPDETAFNHHLFLRSDSNESWCMIRPILYKLDRGVPKEVPPNIDSMKLINDEQEFYVLDSGFNIIIFNQFSRSEHKIALHHSTNENLVYCEPQNDSLKRALEFVRNQIITNRNFEPSIILTQRGHSQARFLMARLDPVGQRESPLVQVPKSKWWQFTQKSKPQEPSEDLSQDQFYEEFIEKIENFRIEGDY